MISVEQLWNIFLALLILLLIVIVSDFILMAVGVIIDGFRRAKKQREERDE